MFRRGSAEHGRASVFPKDAEAGDDSPASRTLLKKAMKYIEHHFTLRIHRKDGTAKLLLGVTGSPPKIGSVKEIKVAKDVVLKVKVVDRPRRDEPAEAIEV
jgi:hypothetical protein